MDFDKYLRPPEDNRQTITVCCECGEEIREGDTYYSLPCGDYCEYCISDYKKEADYYG